MLTATQSRTWFWFLFGLLTAAQWLMAFQQQLFGDEAFYWLESRHLAWSYTELPGWTQWMVALSDRWLPHQPFFLRLPSLLAAMCLPFIVMGIARRLFTGESTYQVGLLMLCLPLLSLAGVLAIPDIWVLFFGVLAVWLLVRSILSSDKHWYVWLGLVLALGINVHLRFWLVILLAGMLTLWCYRNDRPTISRLTGITLPLMCLGFLPVLWFNLQHDFVMFGFQLGDRHPWTFQPAHFAFFLVQLLVTTPLVFMLCLRLIGPSLRHSQLVRLLAWLAISHWLFYALSGFITDNLRFNWHWPLLSYVWLLILTPVVSSRHPAFIRMTIISGFVLNIGWLMLIQAWGQDEWQPRSFGRTFTANNTGWEQLASHTHELAEQLQVNEVITDHFMTFSTLSYYAGEGLQLSVLPNHPLNQKHGRQAQLAIMGYPNLANQPGQLLVVEHTALSLEQHIPFYLNLCATHGGIRLVDQLSIRQGLKSYYYFISGEQLCELPPIHYLERQGDQLTGWLVSRDLPTQPQLLTPAGPQPVNLQPVELGSNPMFNELPKGEYQRLRIEPLPLTNGYPVQLSFNYQQIPILSDLIWP
jgi:4-amino-4-deoxy-L-arabinose transferase-like glycosyltransferase